MVNNRASTTTLMHSIVKEPLVHFLILGALLFAVFYLFNEESGETSTEIVVTESDAEWLYQNWERVWSRSPTKTELESLIQTHIREEIYFREALAAGLEIDDTIIRRRLVQKLEFLSEDLMALSEPSDEILRLFYREHSEDYRMPSRYTFEQVYVNVDERGVSALQDAESILGRLTRSPNDSERVGDPIMLGYDFDNITEREIERLFGGQFSNSLKGVEVGVWRGPIESGLGLHLVFVREVMEGRPLEFEEVIHQVRLEYETENKREMEASFYAALRDRYTVTIERSDSSLTTGLSIEGVSNPDEAGN